MNLRTLAAALLLAAPAQAAQPVFSDIGPDAAAYGAPTYPVGTFGTANRQAVMVGSYSHYDTLRPAHIVGHATPAPLRRDTPEPAIAYTYRDEPHTILDYLDRHPTTALLILRNDSILFEHYRYARTDQDRLVSQSMAKTVTALLVGIALAENRIRSIDDTAETYAPALAGTLHGAAPLRALLTMSSGVQYRETYGEPTADNSRFATALFGRAGQGAPAALATLTTRAAPPSTRFNYAGADTETLAVVLQAVTGMPLSAYLESRIWHPMGAEADAGWLLDATGLEPGYCCLTATARDWARLGLLMANEGAANGKQIVPKAWIAAMTRPDRADLAPGRATRFDGYGFQTWLLPGNRGAFALRGIHGQAVFVDPRTKIVMVHTAVRIPASNDPATAELATLWRAIVAQLGTPPK